MLSEEIDYPVTAQCMEKSLICGFTKASFEKWCWTIPMSVCNHTSLSTRIASLTNRVGSMSFSNLEDRLHRVL